MLGKVTQQKDQCSPAHRMTDRKQLKNAPQLVMDKSCFCRTRSDSERKTQQLYSKEQWGRGKVTLIIRKEDCGPIEHMVSRMETKLLHGYQQC